ncbi:MAG: Hpt domain-containing protein [Betaproteobacteria bacterium]|nr:Hpt domain-containing protein [Betaproteobacteria bacterium]
MSGINDFAGMRELMQDFIQESAELLATVDGKLLGLERSPNDVSLRNDLFRVFHSIKGGAGFLNADELVSLCQLAENLFDPLGHTKPRLDAETMKALSAVTGEIRHMLHALRQGVQPPPAPAELVASLQAALEDSLPRRMRDS